MGFLLWRAKKLSCHWACPTFYLSLRAPFWKTTIRQLTQHAKSRILIILFMFSVIELRVCYSFINVYKHLACSLKVQSRISRLHWITSWVLISTTLLHAVYSLSLCRYISSVTPVQQYVFRTQVCTCTQFKSAVARGGSTYSPFVSPNFGMAFKIPWPECM